MKKKVCVTAMLTALLAIILAGCVSKPDYEYIRPDMGGAPNLMEGATIVSERLGKKEKADAANLLTENDKYWTPKNINRYTDNNDGYDGNNAMVEIQLKDVYTFNTAILSEKGGEVQYFRLQAWVNNSWQTVYRSEKIQELRLISFEPVTTDRIRLSVDRWRGKKVAKIDSIELYNVAPRDAEEFNVTVYQRLDSDVPSEILAKGEDYVNMYAQYYNVYNTVLVFGAVNWDADGKMVFTVKDGEEGFRREIAALKEIISHRTNPHDVRIIVTALADGAAGGGHDNVNRFMEKNYESVAEQMVQKFVVEYDLDGVDIDWEYPQTEEDWQCYDKFIKTLDEKMTAIKEDSIISAALSAWSLQMSPDTLKRIDQVQLMAYDDFDEDHQQSTLQSAQRGVCDLVRNGASLSQINIGIPTYGRPVSGSPYWANWRDLESANYFDNKYYNVECNGEVFDGTYCSPAMAGDKTAYAILSGIGGVMAFRLACDKTMDDPNAVAHGIQDALERYIIGWGE